MITRRLIISGRVQGVFFRESMRQEAERLGITGWVRNLADGRVEAVVQGTDAAVLAILSWSRHGPAAAEVRGVETTPAEGNFTSFERRPTATSTD